MKTKTVGIIGGLGPETTANFYLEIIAKSKMINPNHRPQIMIWSVPMDLNVEKSFIQGSDESNSYIELLIDAAIRLKKAGAEFLVIPCNSVHIFIEQVRQAVDIPVLSIVEETKNFLIKNQISSVGLLATSATINSNLYNKTLEKNQIKVVLPTDNEQQALNLSITQLVNHESSQKDQERLLQIIDSLSNQGVQATLLACTDLQLIVPSRPKASIYDTMHILVDATVKEIFN